MQSFYSLCTWPLSSGILSRLIIAALLYASVAAHTSAHAQTPAPTAIQLPDAASTFHVYNDLVQLPTLVLDAQYRPLAPIPPQKFNISLDSGPRFHPTLVRREGDDPLAIAILLDLSFSQDDLLPAIRSSLSNWASQSLHPTDHISIYALDCTLIRTSDNVPADPALLLKGFDLALASPTVHGKKKSGACGDHLPFFNALGVITGKLAQLPGRRIILAISDGKDNASTIEPGVLRQYENKASIAVFGISYIPGFKEGQLSAAQSAFGFLCDSTGGIDIASTVHSLPNNLTRFVAMLRDRYILEFPRPSNPTPGEHGIDVMIEKTLATVRPSGLILPTHDPSAAAYENTVPTDRSQAPQIGKHPTPPPSR